MEWEIGVFLRPFAALALFLFAWWLSKLLYRLLPEGRLRRLLYSRLSRRLRR
jgi:hypothetical protein